MRAVAQRVSRAEIRVGEETVGSMGAGLLVLVGVAGRRLAQAGFYDPSSPRNSALTKAGTLPAPRGRARAPYLGGR